MFTNSLMFAVRKRANSDKKVRCECFMFLKDMMNVVGGLLRDNRCRPGDGV